MLYKRPTFSLDSMGMAPMGGKGRGKPFVINEGIFSRGPRTGGGMRAMPAAGGMDVMPPTISYPFRQPPLLLTPSAGAGMSM
jgi:hypothetical protein